MHCYLFVRCKTERCDSHLLLLHFEAPEAPHIPIDYPFEKYFPLRMGCPGCAQTHRYLLEDIETKTASSVLHDEKRPLPFPFPPEESRDRN